MSEDYAQMIADCEKRESKLTDWERGFIDSLSMRMFEKRGLTTKQAEALDAIWERVT